MTLGDSEFARRLDRIQSNNLSNPKINNKPIEPKDVGLEDDDTVIDASTQPVEDDNLGKNWQNTRHYK